MTLDIPQAPAGPVSLAKLKVWPDNPRTLKKRDFERLKRDMQRHQGLLEARPLVALPDGTVIMGNMRLRAAQELGWRAIPCMTVDLSPEEAHAWAMIDNNAYGEWDETNLAELLARDQAQGFDVRSMGFRPELLERLLGREQPGKRSAADLPTPQAPKSPVVRRGDVWRLGQHTLYCGDCRDQEASALFEGKCAMLFCDPPYGIAYQSNRPKGGPKFDRIDGDDVVTDFGEVWDAWLRPDSALYICCGHQTLPEFRAAYDARFRYRNTIIWDKGNGSMGDLAGSYQSKYECILFYHKGQSYLREKREQDIWPVDRVPPKEHPIQKPVELVQRAIRQSSDRGDVVGDPTAGSGTTLFAAHELERASALAEINPGYAEVILQRWLLLTREDAVRQDGMRYSDLLTGKGADDAPAR